MSLVGIIKTTKMLRNHLLECEELLSRLEDNSLTEENMLLLDSIDSFIQNKHSQSLLNNEEESRFVDLIDSIPSVAIQGYNKEREVIYWNEASENIYGYSASEALGEKLEELIIPAEMHDAVKSGIHEWFENGTIIPSQELMLKRKDGSTAHVFSSHVMLGKDSSVPEMFCMDVDLSEVGSLRDENKTLETKVHFDQLTNIHNRYFLESVIDQKIEYSKSQDSQLSLIMFDVDFFKKINDRYGHNIGDKSLIFLAKIINRIVKPEDIFVRWGGEEFMLLMDKSFSGTVQMANKIRRSIELETDKSVSIPYFTCSFGVVDMSQHWSFKEAYDLIDEKLYSAKNNGRNRVEY